MDSTRPKRTHRQGYHSGLGRQWLCDCEAKSVTHLGAMSASGQNRKSSMRAHVFCFAPESGHCGTESACPFRARLGHRPDYSITSSASASNGGGTRIPSVFAVFRLMNSSNLDACITGRSAVFSPLRILPAYKPACRYRSLMLAP